MHSTYAQWLRYGAYTVLVLAVVVGGYYFVYVQQRTEQLSNDRLALLQESSGYFTEELGRVKRNIRNTLQDSSKLESPKKLAKALAEISGVDTAGVNHVSPKDWSSMRPVSIDSVSTDSVSIDSVSIDSVLNYSEFIDSESIASKVIDTVSLANGTDFDPTQTGCQERSQSYEAGSDDGIELITTFQSTVNQPLLTFKLTTGKEPHCPLASVNLKHLLLPLLPRSETAFDKVVLARENGRVLVSSGKGPISIEKLPLHEQSIVNQKAPGDTTRGRYSEIFTMEAAGLSHRVFLQPFRVPVGIDYPGDEEDDDSTAIEGGEEILYLAGVKQEQAFRAEARKLPPTLLALLMGVVALALLAFPFLEVWLIGPTESFRASDVLEVAVGVVIASSIVTLAGLSFFSVGQLEDRQFDQLKEFSNVLRTALKDEAKAANQQLTHLSGLVRECDSSCRQQTQIWKDDIKVDESSRVNDSFRGVSHDSLRYPHLEMASWINKEARQVAKWSVEDQTTPLINLSDRGYVRAHEAALGWPWSSSQHSEVWEYREGDSTEWVLESIRSKNTGEVFAQISQQNDVIIKDLRVDSLSAKEINHVEGDTVYYDIRERVSSDDTVHYEDRKEIFSRVDSVGKKVATVTDSTIRAVVAAATLPLLSVIEPVLPPGFRFAVIDREGEVLFHSDTRRNLRENIFDKIIGGEHLRDAVFARRADQATAQYREDTYQFYAHPVSDSPWTLLVFAELQPLRAMHGQILTTGLVLYAGYLFFLLIVLLIWMAASSEVDRFSLRGLFYALWPDAGNDGCYRFLLLGESVAFLVGLGFLLLALVGGVSWPLIGTFLLSALALLLFCHYCSGGGPTFKEVFGSESASGRLRQTLGMNGRSWTNHYIASLFILVLNVGVLPVLVSYTVLHDESAELLTKKNQLVFAERLQDRGEKWADEYRRIALNDMAHNTLSAHLFPGGTWPPSPTTIFPDWAEVRGVHTIPHLPLPVTPYDTLGAYLSPEWFGLPSSPKSLADSTETWISHALLRFPPLIRVHMRDPYLFWTRLPLDGKSHADSMETRNAHAIPRDPAWDMYVVPYLPDSMEAQLPWDVHPIPGFLEVESHSEYCKATPGAGQPVYSALHMVPFLEKTSVWGHNLYLFSDSKSAGDSWTWMHRGDGVGLCIPDARRAGLPPPGQESPDRRNLLIAGSVPTLAALFGQDPGLAVLGILVFVVLFVVVLWWALRTLHTRIFFMDVASVVTAGGSSSSADGQSDGPDRILHLRGRPEGSALDASTLRGEGREEDLIETAREADGPVVVEHFHDGLDDAEEAERKRALLEALGDLDVDVWVYSDFDPLPYLIDRFYEEDVSTPTPIDLEAWATALRPFRKEFPSPELEDSEVESWRDVVERECEVDPYLDGRVGDIKRAVGRDRDGEALTSETKKQVEEQVKYHARSHYHHLWMTCTDEEKVILHRLSTDGFVSPHAQAVVKQLLRRGLVIMEPELRPMNESFRRFVAGLDSPIIAQYEEKASSRAWNRVRVPLLLGFGLVLGFVFLTQPDLVREWMGTLAPALAAGVPALLNVAAGLFGGKGGVQSGGGQ